jgi:hypothetical protein
MVLPVSDDVLGVLFSGSSVYFQIWKVRLCHMKYSNKIGKTKKQKKNGSQYCWGTAFRVHVRVLCTYLKKEISSSLTKK